VLARMFADGATRLPTVDLVLDRPTLDGRSLATQVELKTIHMGPARYPPARGVLPRAAVDARASAVPRERVAQLVALDRKFLETPEGVRGPFEARLDAFPGGVLGVATGAFGEWSSSLVELVDGLAAHGAGRWMCRLGAPSLDTAKATLLRLYRQRIGMCVLRGHAKLLLARAQQVYLQQGRGAGAAWAQRSAPAPVGVGPEVGGSAFARLADGAHWWCDVRGSRGAGGGGGRGWGGLAGRGAPWRGVGRGRPVRPTSGTGG